MAFSPEDEEKERLAAEEARIAAKKQAEEDAVAHEEQIGKVKKVKNRFSWLYAAWLLTANIIRITGHSIGVAAELIPPLHTIINGFTSILELVEAIFLSKETRMSRIVQGTNAFLSNGLSIAALVLSFNPLTFHVAGILTLGAMATATMKDAFFWYKTSKELRLKKNAVALEKESITQEITILADKKEETKKTLLEVNSKLQILMKDNSPASKEELAKLKERKQELSFNIKKYNRTIQQHQITISHLDTNLNELTKKRDEKRKSFFFSLASTIGASFMVLAAFAAVGTILANPFTLSVVGISLLAVTTVVMVKARFFTKKSPKVEPIDDAIIKSEPEMVEEPAEEQEQLDEHLGDTMDIAHKIALASHRKESDILKSDRDFYHAIDKDRKQEGPVQVDEQNPQVTSAPSESPDPNKNKSNPPH